MTDLPPPPVCPLVPSTRFQLLPTTLRGDVLRPEAGAASRPEEVLPAHRPRVLYHDLGDNHVTTGSQSAFTVR